MRPRILPLALGLLLAVTVASCASSDDDGPAGVPPGAMPGADELDGGDGSLHPVLLADLGEPVTALAAHPDGRWLLAARRSGAVFRIELADDGGHLVPRLDPQPVLDLGGTVTTEGERGLFDLLFSPDGAEVYASYTDPDGAVTVARFPFDAADGAIDAADPPIVARVDHPFAGHNAGDLDWLDDTTLLWSIGDMDLTASTPPAAQDPTNPLGSIVRIDVSDPGAPTLTGDELVGDHVVAVGLRNPWRMHLDAATGTLLVGDVGEDRFEEIDTLTPGAPGTEPVNFGWPWFEGDDRTDLAPAGLDDADFRPPLLAMEHADDVCAVAAGVTVPDALSRTLRSRFLFGDNCSGQVQALDLQDGSTEDVAEVDDGVVAFALGVHDDAYVLGLSGGIWRLDPDGWSVEAPSPPSVPAPPPNEDDAAADLPADQFQAVCEARTAFALLEDVLGADPATFRADALQATTIFAGAVDRLPAEVDAASLQAVVDASVAVGRSTGWDVSDPAFLALSRAVTGGEPPYDDFAEAMATLVDLGAAC